jgi:predicted nucleic acid-binding protein
MYELLAKIAKQAGSTPEGLAVEWLRTAIRNAIDDPVENFIGAFSSTIPGWADQHDKYVGQALLTSPLRIPRPATIAFIEALKTSPYVEVVHVDSMLDEKAWQLLKSHQDKEWSLVDCASFVLMRQRSIFEALTTDHNYEQAGFVRLLKS